MEAELVAPDGESHSDLVVEQPTAYPRLRDVTWRVAVPLGARRCGRSGSCRDRNSRGSRPTPALAGSAVHRLTGAESGAIDAAGL
jgi:hypothetical protein